jgi:hypothetical protein
MWIIGALPFEYSIHDARQLVRLMREGDHLVFAPVALAIMHSTEHRGKMASRESGRPDRAAQIRRAALAHLRLVGCMTGCGELGVNANQGHELIGSGAAPDVPNFLRDGRRGRGTQARNRRQMPRRTRVTLGDVSIPCSYQALQLTDLPPEQPPAKGQCLGPASYADTLVRGLLDRPRFLRASRAARRVATHPFLVKATSWVRSLSVNVTTYRLVRIGPSCCGSTHTEEEPSYHIHHGDPLVEVMR